MDKGKEPISGDGTGEDGFVPVKARNMNQRQKQTFRERQEDDTFNKFEVLDDLNHQEVNLGLMHLDQGNLGTGKDGPPLEAMQNVQDLGGGQMGTDQQLNVHVESDPVMGVLKSGGGGSPFLIRDCMEGGKSSLSSSHMGIQQKEPKKGVGEKNPKLGRKKEMEKIKSTRETLVDSGVVKTLDSHFSCPQK